MVERIELGNGLILEIWDYSRKIAGDRWLVGFLAQVGIKPTKEDFSSEIYFQKFVEKTDGYLYYRYDKKRTFVPESEVVKIYQNLRENFLKAVLPYLQTEQFKERLLSTEVAKFEKKIDWELYLENKEREEDLLEAQYKDKEIF